MQGEARHIFGYVTYRVREMVVRAGRFVGGLKAAGVESCLRLGQSISQEQNPNRAANITLASVALAASIINHINASNGCAYRS